MLTKNIFEKILLTNFRFCGKMYNDIISELCLYSGPPAEDTVLKRT